MAHLTRKYMTAHFHDLVQALQEKVAVLYCFMGNYVIFSRLRLQLALMTSKFIIMVVI
jgi:hypothetical protein